MQHKGWTYVKLIWHENNKQQEFGMELNLSFVGAC